MKINEVKYSPYSIKFTTPFKGASADLSGREGIIIEAKTNEGVSSFGEIAPLPGFSIETLKDVTNRLTAITGLLKDKHLPDSYLDLDEFLSSEKLYPSERFGVEQAILNLIINNNRNKFLKELGRAFYSQIKVNAVLGIRPLDETISEIRRFIREGFNTVKIKAGRKNPGDDISIADAVRNEFGSRINIRIDMNGSLDTKTAGKFLTMLQNYNIQYVEQPVAGIDDLINLSMQKNFPLAADESLRSFDDAVKLCTKGNVKFLIVKPMLCGGFTNTMKIIDLAEKNCKAVIISSAFESAVGRSQLAMISSLTSHNCAHGLATAGYFEEDLYADKYPVIKGKIDFDNKLYPPTFLKGQ